MSSRPRSAPPDRHYDVVIAGAGVSGLYTAWRLLADPPAGGRRPAVAVFEAGDRVGGRLLTWNPTGPRGGLRAELGGMRFFAGQELVFNLIQSGLGMGRQVVKFYADGYPGLIRYLRARHMPAADDSVVVTDDPPDPTRKRYWLNEEEQQLPHKRSVDLLRRVMHDVLRRNGYRPEDLTTRKAFDEAKGKLRYNGRMLTDVGFWNLLARELSSEAYKFITDSFGYYSLALNWNAAEAIQNITLDFTLEPEYLTLAQGYESLPRALARRVRELGGEIHLESPVLQFDVDAKGLVTAMVGGPDGARRPVSASRLVLALPRRSLELLSPTPSFDWQRQEKLRRLLASARPYPAFKLFLFYERRWWEDPDRQPYPVEAASGPATGKIEHGRSVCDLPVRQTYYLRPDVCEQPGWTWADGPWHGLLMASYDDSTVVDFWRGMEPTAAEKVAGRVQLTATMRQVMASFAPAVGATAPGVAAQAGATAGAGATAEADQEPEWTPPPNMHLATPDMVEQAERQLRELHGLPRDASLAPVLGAAYADWTVDPFGGGWHFWEPQYPVLEVMRKIKTPLGADQPVYLVGEAYSGLQGWVEGALTTAEVVLQRHLGLHRPGWLPAGYYLGD